MNVRPEMARKCVTLSVGTPLCPYNIAYPWGVLIIRFRVKDSGRCTAKAEDAQGTTTQSHISPNILVNKDYSRSSFEARCVEPTFLDNGVLLFLRYYFQA